jgi:predicted dehydrogenase
MHEPNELKAMKDDRIGVGVIGASPINPGWAVKAHIPALKALPGYELRAVSTSRRGGFAQV